MTTRVIAACLAFAAFGACLLVLGSYQDSIPSRSFASRWVPVLSLPLSAELHPSTGTGCAPPTKPLLELI